MSDRTSGSDYAELLQVDAHSNADAAQQGRRLNPALSMLIILGSSALLWRGLVDIAEVFGGFLRHL